MAIEIEVKMAVPDLGPVRQTLRQLGAEGGGLTLETNVFFDTPGALLQKAGSGLRLRTNHDASSGRETFVITHKGPLLAGPTKSREETELTVENADDATKLFEKLGFAKTLSFQKRRESWKLKGCKVELDEVPHLGCYVEVEGPSEDLVMQVRGELGLGKQPAIKSGYISMLMDYLKQQGQTATDIKFPAPSGQGL